MEERRDERSEERSLNGSGREAVAGVEGVSIVVVDVELKERRVGQWYDACW